MHISEAEVDDDLSFTRHLKVLEAEFRKSKPNLMVVKELMSITFEKRQADIKENPSTIRYILQKYPFLQKEDQVCISTA